MKRYCVDVREIDDRPEGRGYVVRYELELREYTNYGSGSTGIVHHVGFYNTEEEAKHVKKVILFLSHEACSLRFKIKKVVHYL